jgi:hypothetical protein
MFFDPYYLLFVGPFILISLWASWRVKSTFHKFSNVGVRSGMTGAEAAAAVARSGGASDITIERVDGFLSDHYDPRSKTLRLSSAVFDGRSISSIAVGAHEAGHAIQHARAYAWLGFRSQMVPVAGIVSQLWIWIFFAGMLMHAPALAYVGVALFAVVRRRPADHAAGRIRRQQPRQGRSGQLGDRVDTGGSAGRVQGARCGGNDVRGGGADGGRHAGLLHPAREPEQSELRPPRAGPRTTARKGIHGPCLCRPAVSR